MAILVVGSVAFDTIETPSGRAERCLGGAATYFALAASYFTDVRVIAVVGEDFTAEHEDDVLKRRGIDTRGIEHIAGKSFFWSGSYLEESERSADAEHRAECLSDVLRRRFRPNTRTASICFSRISILCCRQNVRSRMPKREAGLRRHDELLDQRPSREPGARV